MNKSESKYFNTALKMDKALLSLLEQKSYAYITVKEICEKASVNRSTFYLHYETMEDLLAESVEYLNDHFLAHMKQTPDAFVSQIEQYPIDQLYLITPEYLTPYLSYIKEHKRLFSTAIKNTKVLRLDESYEKMFRIVFEPILERYQVPVRNRRYVMTFYIQGLMSIITQWVKADCEDSIEQIIEIMQDCVKQTL